MRDATGELADGFQLLRLAQGPFGCRAAVNLGIKRLRAPQDRKQGHQQQKCRRKTENELRCPSSPAIGREWLRFQFRP